MDYPVIDQPRFPAPGPTYEARVSVRMEWQGGGEKLGWSNPLERYRLGFYRARARIAVEARVPSLGFSFVSDSMDSSESLFAMIGTVTNGVFF